MIRAVVDTNVFISGVFWKGSPLKVLEAWIDGKFKLITTTEILVEYERVLETISQKTKFSDHKRILELVKLNAEMVNPIAFTRPVCRDKHDDKFLAAAIGGGAQYIVTGDADLLILDAYHDIKIKKPKAFLYEI